MFADGMKKGLRGEVGYKARTLKLTTVSIVLSSSDLKSVKFIDFSKTRRL